MKKLLIVSSILGAFAISCEDVTVQNNNVQTVEITTITAESNSNSEQTKTLLDEGMKTKIQSVIPILNTTREILEKYDYRLPILSNQKYNCYLKELGDICNIKQELHTHLARHTMATICINNGIDINIIAKILGHSTSRTTLSIYAHLLNDTVLNAKDKLNDIFK